MRDVLEALAAGEITVEAAEAEISGYVTADVGRFDAARESRRGIPEAILADGKTPEEVATLTRTAIESTGRALVTRAEATHRERVRELVDREYPDASLLEDERSGVLTVHAADYELPSLETAIGVVTAGTADAGPAGEAAAVVRELGADVVRIDDVGVANLTRVTDRIPQLRELDVIIVAAGREGALPTVVAGLVDAPVIALPISAGYGHGGDGAAALAGMLQSCTVLSVVNIDAGFVAGAQAGLIARAIDKAKTEGGESSS